MNMVIYPVDNTIHLLNIRDQGLTSFNQPTRSAVAMLTETKMPQNCTFHRQGYSSLAFFLLL